MSGFHSNIQETASSYDIELIGRLCPASKVICDYARENPHKSKRNISHMYPKTEFETALDWAVTAK